MIRTQSNIVVGDRILLIPKKSGGYFEYIDADVVRNVNKNFHHTVDNWFTELYAEVTEDNLRRMRELTDRRGL